MTIGEFVFVAISSLEPTTDFCQMFQSSSESHKDALTKSSHLVTKRMLETVNASVEYKFIQPQWGFKSPKTGMYNGMIGDLQRNEVEIGGSVLYMVSDRVPLLDYVTMTTPTRAHFVFRAPPLSYVSNIYGLPFSSIVWICTACLVLFATVVLYLSYRFGPSLMTDCRSISDFMLVAIGTVCQMGTQISPKIISGRISLVSRMCSCLDSAQLSVICRRSFSFASQRCSFTPHTQPTLSPCCNRRQRASTPLKTCCIRHWTMALMTHPIRVTGSRMPSNQREKYFTRKKSRENRSLSICRMASKTCERVCMRCTWKSKLVTNKSKTHFSSTKNAVWLRFHSLNKSIHGMPYKNIRRIKRS